MKTFEAEVIRRDLYKIEIDEQVWNEQALKDWGSVFHQVDSVEDIAEHLAICIIRNGFESFLEGFGYVRTFHQSGRQYIAHGEGLKPLADDAYCKGVRVTLNQYDNDYQVDL